MNLDLDSLRRLSTLLDTALALPPGQRAAWLDTLEGLDAALVPRLREALARGIEAGADDMLERGPQFSLPAAEAATDLTAGCEIAGYRLLRLLGRGGMGEVWLAERADGVLKRQVALKLPMLGVRRSTLVQRFARERDIVGALAHPHIARLYDAGVADDGQPYLAFEYVDGEPITHYAASHRLDVRQRVKLMLQVADAVQYAHTNLVVHRDLKPGNVLVTPGGHAMLLDFGIAKLLEGESGQAQATELTQVGGRALTPDYAAPEQLSGEPISTATDVYALGLIAYELLTQRRPFSGTSRTAIEQAIIASDPPRPSHIREGVLARMPGDLASDLDAIVLKALKRSPAERYPTVNALSADLERWLAGEPVLARHDSFWYRARKFATRHRFGVAAGVAIGLTLVGATAFSAWQASIARREARTAEAVETFMRNVFSANSSAQANPVAARNMTARELLDRGAERIDAALAKTPEAHARVLQTVAHLYADLAMYPQALELRRRQVALLRKLRFEDGRQLAHGLSALGVVALLSGEIGEARRALDEALSILVERGDETSVDRGVVESRIAYFHIQLGLDGGLPHVRRAVSILRMHPPSTHLIDALMRYSYLASDVGEVEPSMVAIRDGLAIAKGLGERGVDSIAPLHQEISRLHLKRYEWREAEASMRLAYDDTRSRHGSNAPQAITMGVDLGQVAFEHGLYRRALAVLDDAGSAAETRIANGDRTWGSALALGYRGAARAMTGAIDEGIADLERAVGMEVAMAANPQVHDYLLELLADARMLRGDYAGAAKALDESEAVEARQTNNFGPNAVTRQSLARLRLATASGARDEARRLITALKLDQTRDYESRPVSISNEHRDGTIKRVTVVANARLGAGDAEGALADARLVLGLIPDSRNAEYHRERERRVSLIAGKALVALGRPADALPYLRRSVALGESPLDIAQTLQHADAIVALASALAETGERDEARALVSAAQAVHDRYRVVAAHFREPLSRVATQLAMKDAPPVLHREALTSAEPGGDPDGPLRMQAVIRDLADPEPKR